MADMRDLWWAAGQLASSAVSTTDWMNTRWHQALRRSATLLEPAWPKDYSDGPFTHALPTIALLLYACQGDPKQVPAEQIVAALDASDPSVEEAIRKGLTERGHDLDDDSPLSALFRQLTAYHPPLTHTASGTELAATDHWPGGTMMGVSAQRAAHAIAAYHLADTSTA